MPTGLTSKIYDGTDVSLRGFALKCLTQLGAGHAASNYGETELPLDHAPLLKESDYHIKSLKRAEDNLAYWKGVKENKELLQNLYEEDCKRYHEEFLESEKRYNESKERYENMIKRVEEWDLPEEYQSLKKLMLEQLRQSLTFDCSPEFPPEEGERPTIEKWVDTRIEIAEWDVKYHTEQIEKEKEKVERVNKYMSGIYAELDKVDPLKK